jgi:hypothetical protein
MSLEQTKSELGWPERKWILEPPGAGAAVNAALAQEKIGRSLVSLAGAQGAQVGVLTLDPQADETQAPLALVCEFPRPVPIETLAELHRLAWNFSRTPVLLTVEPHQLRAFTCCEQPSRKVDDDTLPPEISEARHNFTNGSRQSKAIADRATYALHWLELASGRFIQRHQKRFLNEYRADNLLLDNLRVVRAKLHEEGSLALDIVHDLLARVIFIQFLFHRRDPNGYAALSPSRLADLYERGVLSEPYTSLGEILTNHTDTYQLFSYLNERFNGDLFPGKGTDQKERDWEWRAEMKAVQPEHLALLSEFVEGKLEIRSGQFSLWPQYSFDTIPLEFISSIYETFVKPQPGTVYTPGYLVDFVLDGVLPWRGQEWDLKILDPACGSGIFLVKAFQRLVYRWKQTHPDQRIGSDILRSLLENNLFGVDTDPHAVRVASFSLYLEMCDEIEPRYYWQQIRFPVLRGRRLLARDFFKEDTPGLKTKENARQYDIVVGNPPWGKATLRRSSAAQEWVRQHEWPISYDDIGPLFMAKAAELTKSTGRVAMLQPCNTLLFNSTAQALRTRIFKTFHVEEIVNLAALRFNIFSEAIGPAALIMFRPNSPSGESLTYIVPKPTQGKGDNEYRIVIDPYDIHELSPEEASDNPIVWTTLMWGSRRDVALLGWLNRWPTLAKYEHEGKIRTRWGIVRGDRTKKQKDILGRPLLGKDFSEDVFLSLDPRKLDTNDDPMTDGKASTDFSAFEPQQLIIKQAWTVKHGRFKAAIVDPPEAGVLCSNSYVSVHAEEQEKTILEAACLSYNSNLAVYYLFRCSARFASYRPSINLLDLLTVPCPSPEKGLLKGVKTLANVDQRIRELFKLKAAEWVLVEDTLRYALPDFKGGEKSPGRLPTHRGNGHGKEKSELHDYCDWFLRVLCAGFGEDKSLCATIFEESSDIRQPLPVRLVAIHLNWPGRRGITVETMKGDQLTERLHRVHSLLVEDSDQVISFRRVARVFDVLEDKGKRIPTIFIAKLDQARYWSRSMALRDADEISQEIMQWQDAGGWGEGAARTT